MALTQDKRVDIFANYGIIVHDVLQIDTIGISTEQTHIRHGLNPETV